MFASQWEMDTYPLKKKNKYNKINLKIKNLYIPIIPDTI